MNDDHALDEPLRRALRAAADSVEPGADGLDRILAKARMRRSARPVRYGLAAAVRRLSLAWPSGPGLRGWAAAACRWIADGFGADAGQPGRLGWLRPAAALATALFVATGTAWAVTTLPQVLTAPGGNPRPYFGATNGSPGPTVSSPVPGASQPGQGPGPGTSGSGTPSPSPSCSSGSNLTPYSPSPSLTPSPSPTSSPSTSPSPSGTGSQSPTPSPSPAATSGSPSSSAAVPPRSDDAVDDAVTPTPTATPTPTSSATSPGPCG